MSLDDFEQLPIADRLYYASSLRVGGTVLSGNGITQVVGQYWGGTPGLSYSAPTASDSASTVVNDWFSWAKIATDGVSGQPDAVKFFSAEFLDLSNDSDISGQFSSAATNVHGVLSRNVDREDDIGTVQSVGPTGTTTVQGRMYKTRTIAVLTGGISDPLDATYAFVPYVEASGETAGAWVASQLSS